MKTSRPEFAPEKTSRRQWLAEGAAALAGGSLLAGLDIARAAHAGGSDTIRLGFVGCGNRGTGACREALSTKAPMKLVAVGDLFAPRIEQALKNLNKRDELRPRIDVPAERQFVGFDAYQKVIDAGVDLVLLTTPPHFRPIHYAAAAAAGKHVFLEKPCCVDAPGYRMLQAANQVAKEKKLSVAVGLQRHHQRNYLEGIGKIRDGVVGQVLFVRTYFNMPGGRSGAVKPAGMSEMEYQLRHWNLFCWLCGDHLVEQACHEIDVANWVLGGPPQRANGMGGRQIRRGPGTGDIWDHHVIEYEYAGGARHFCQARQQPGTWTHVSDNVHGTKGSVTLGTGAWGMGDVTPRSLHSKRYRGDDPYQREHDDLAASILGSGPHVFEGQYGATSSMTAVMGRMATYSGQLLTWEQAINSAVKLAPAHYAWDANPPTLPDADGNYPVAMPGVTKAW
jgi:myo-inositol 2-dehydrogenase / D-chiro-inositol 1-dehydrogenase